MSQNQNNNSSNSGKEERQDNERIRKIHIEESDDECDDREKLIETFMQVELRECRLELMEKESKKKVWDFFPKEFHPFINESYLIHDSPISLVELGERRNIHSLKNINCVEEEQKEKPEKEYKEHEEDKSNIEELIVLKAIKQPSTALEQILTMNDINFIRIDDKDRHYLITKERFEGINLASIISYFSNTSFINLQVIEELLQQLIVAVEDLHNKKIIHGDISPGNIVVKAIKREKIVILENQERVYEPSKLEHIYKSQLENIVNYLYNIEEQDLEEDQERYFVSLSLIDYSHSWIENLAQNFSNIIEEQREENEVYTLKNYGNLTSHELQYEEPTQTINYRSPEALYKRGSYLIDVWGIGHVLFTLLTGEDIFSSEISWNEHELEQIFTNEKEFHNHINSTLKLREETVNKEQSKLYNKLIKIFNKCILIDPEKRPSIQELSELFYSDN